MKRLFVDKDSVINDSLDEDGSDHGIAASTHVFPAPLDIADLVRAQLSLRVDQIFRVCHSLQSLRDAHDQSGDSVLPGLSGLIAESVSELLFEHLFKDDTEFLLFSESKKKTFRKSKWRLK